MFKSRHLGYYYCRYATATTFSCFFMLLFIGNINEEKLPSSAVVAVKRVTLASFQPYFKTSEVEKNEQKRGLSSRGYAFTRMG